MERAKYPLGIFPEEIWEMIILRVEDSEDLRSLMKASKQLNGIFARIRHLWLLDKVLPHLFPTTNESKCYLKFGDVKSLRLVDKRWRRGVNTYLQNQPYLCPYKKGDDKQNSKEHIWPERHNKEESIYRSKIFGRVIFQDYSQLQKFKKTFKNCSKNPFPSRSVIGYATPDLAIPGQDEKKVFLEEMDRKVLKQFGRHIWFLAMEWEEGACGEKEYDPRSVWKCIVNSLQSVPNLKGLTLELAEGQGLEIREMGRRESKIFLKSKENKLPHLPFLDSLKMILFGPVSLFFCKELVSKYHLQLRTLDVSIEIWKHCKIWGFPNLVELSLEGIVIEEATHVLTSLEAPQLAKLKLHCYSVGDANITVEDVFQWVSLLPSLIYLDISCKEFRIREIGILKPPHNSNFTLKYLRIFNSPGIKYNFLRCLPNLQRLEIGFDKHSDTDANKFEVDKSLYQINIWEVCPKLKTFSLKSCLRDSPYNYFDYDRATYETLKRSADPRGTLHMRHGMSMLVQNNND